MPFNGHIFRVEKVEKRRITPGPDGNSQREARHTAAE